MHRPLIFAAVTLAAFAAAPLRSESDPASVGRDPELAREASWSPPAVEDVRTRLDEALADRGITLGDATAAELDQAWKAAAAGRQDLLDVVIQSVAARDPRAAAAVQAMSMAWKVDAKALQDLHRAIGGAA